MSKILLDLNNPVFQQALFVLPKAEALAVLKIFRKVSQLTCFCSCVWNLSPTYGGFPQI